MMDAFGIAPGNPNPVSQGRFASPSAGEAFRSLAMRSKRANLCGSAVEMSLAGLLSARRHLRDTAVKQPSELVQERAVLDSSLSARANDFERRRQLQRIQ